MFLLQTGLRTGELTGLTWNDIDFEKRTVSVTRTLEYSSELKAWQAGPPKTIHSYRTLPLTATAYDILETLYQNRFARKESQILSQTLYYMDKRNGQTKSIVMRDLVFINPLNGEPVKNSTYDSNLYAICDKANIIRASMHALRHTYATRAIERGVQPKVLQKLLGHAHLQTTMDRYVHVTDDSLRSAVELFENSDYSSM
jgi:integrase